MRKSGHRFVSTLLTIVVVTVIETCCPLDRGPHVALIASSIRRRSCCKLCGLSLDVGRLCRSHGFSVLDRVVLCLVVVLLFCFVFVGAVRYDAGAVASLPNLMSTRRLEVIPSILKEIRCQSRTFFRGSVRNWIRTKNTLSHNKEVFFSVDFCL